ncbi:MAG: UDP-N-acetylmuramate--L-alanine ligase [Clostridia bacterium]|nr:UDP-N-acetylmuramate--L-alanine ligase [Clostridia bacterium]
MLTNCKFFYDKYIKDKTCLILGIGGVSMSSIALVLKSMGYKVSGYDANKGSYTALMEKEGIEVSYGDVMPSLENVGAVVYTAAIKEDFPLLVEARGMGIVTVVRAPFLGELMKCYKTRIGISGTHGKSTTSGMISEIFLNSPLDPTIMIGADLPSINGGVKIGSKDSFVFEACEYKDSFLSFAPTVSVVLNVELDHTDYFKSIDQMKESYTRFMNISDKAVVCADSENAVDAASGFHGEILYYSMKKGVGDLWAENSRLNRGFGEFDAFLRGEFFAHIKLSVPGLFQIGNALAAIGASVLSGIDKDTIVKGLEAFRGVGRRFQYRKTLNGADIYDDYAHHPDEIRATLETAKSLERERVIVVYQPHTYTRTHDLFDDFIKAFDNCDEVIFADIYAAREKNLFGITSKDLADKTPRGKYVGDFEKISEYLKNNIKENDLVLIMGAGDIIKLEI